MTIATAANLAVVLWPIVFTAIGAGIVYVIYRVLRGREQPPAPRDRQKGPYG